MKAKTAKYHDAEVLKSIIYIVMSDEKPLELANRLKDAFSLTHLSVVCSVAASIALQNVTFTSDTQLVLSSLEPQMCANLHFYRRNSCCGGARCT